MTRTRTTISALAACALLASLATTALAQDEAPPVPIEAAEGITWQLVEQSIDGEMTALPDDVVVTLILVDGQAGGSGGCNNYFAAYELDGASLTFGEIGATMMFCEGPAGEVETVYLGNLADVAMWANTGGSLILQDAAGEPTLNFLPADEQPIPVETLEGPVWLLAEQATEGDLAAVPEGILVTITLDDGRAGGNGGCNSYFASYELDGAAITFSEVGSTMMACLGPAADVETAYLANLALVSSWMHDGARLTFSDAEGNAILVYTVAPEASILGGWVASSINNGAEAVVTSEITPLVSAVFDDEGRLSGFDGCNDYFTSYTVEGDRISISDEIGSTMMACESDDLAEQSQQYYAALLAATTWAVSPGGMLELRDDSGALQVSLTAAMG
jgi:heat shock protein HslJ